METKQNKPSKKANTPKKKPSIKHQFDLNYKGDPGQDLSKPSKTVPDQSLTVKQLLENHTRGVSSNVHSYEPQYFDSEIVRHDDIVDAMNHKQKLKEQYDTLEQLVKAEEEEVRKNKKDAAEAATAAEKQKLQELKKKYPQKEPQGDN